MEKLEKLDKAFFELVSKVNDDPLKIFQSSLTYILRFLSIDKKEDISWPYKKEQNQAFWDFMIVYFTLMENNLKTRLWYDAWGDLFMDLSGKFKSFRGQFFTPDGLSDVGAKIAVHDAPAEGYRYINDPTCGSGRMLLSLDQQVYLKFGIRPYIVGEDIDGMCCMMAAINLAVHGCRGEIIKHDTLCAPKGLQVGYIIGETLPIPSIRTSYEKKDFRRLRNE